MGAKTVEDYLEGLSGWQRDVVADLRALIREAEPDLTESVKWSQPVYSLQGPVCYVKAFARHVTFGFWRGTELTGADDLLEGTGGKMRHVKLRSADDVDRDAFGALVREAAGLNRAKGDPTKAMPRSAYLEAREQTGASKA